MLSATISHQPSGRQQPNFLVRCDARTAIDSSGTYCQAAPSDRIAHTCLSGLLGMKRNRNDQDHLVAGLDQRHRVGTSSPSNIQTRAGEAGSC